MTGPGAPASTDRVTDDAVLAADAAARAAGVRIREITALEDLEEVVRLYDRIWRRDVAPPITVELLRAFSKAGNYVAGAYDGAELVGACVGFFAAPAQEALHSHISGVSAALRGRRVGFALKLHQRAWALLRGVTVIAWTFDPLVSRNAYFNVAKLGAEPVEYLPNFYGGMHDAINGDDDSDRLLVHWALAAPTVVAACAGVSPGAPTPAGAGFALAVSGLGRPVSSPADGAVVLVGVPRDIEALRTTDPGLAKEWRVAVRETLTGLLVAGGRVTGFDRNGWYVVTKEAR
jgi:predicted GNAT superfamily acetyltransferase